MHDNTQLQRADICTKSEQISVHIFFESIFGITKVKPGPDYFVTVVARKCVVTIRSMSFGKTFDSSGCNIRRLHERFPEISLALDIDMDMDIHGYPRVSILNVDMDGYG